MDQDKKKQKEKGGFSDQSDLEMQDVLLSSVRDQVFCDQVLSNT